MPGISSASATWVIMHHNRNLSRGKGWALLASLPVMCRFITCGVAAMPRAFPVERTGPA
ncbi:MAG: hypothetical protein ABW203_01250 [Novosphingobium sp.]